MDTNENLADRELAQSDESWPSDLALGVEGVFEFLVVGFGQPGVLWPKFQQCLSRAAEGYGNLCEFKAFAKRGNGGGEFVDTNCYWQTRCGQKLLKFLLRREFER